MSLLRSVSLTAALLLAGCATLPPSDPRQGEAEARWAAQRQSLEQLDHFTLQGRIASGGAFGLTGALRWVQNADGSFDLSLSGPFGAGAVSIAGTPQSVVVRTGEGVTNTSDPEGWIKDRIGWTFPVAGLRWWVLGLPSPHTNAQMDLDAAGQPLTLRQDGWRLEYTEYQSINGLTLPRKFKAANAEAVIKVVVDRWTDLPTP